MHLEMRFDGDGKPRPIWYGRFVINGKKECVNLGVKLVGLPPASRKLRDQGDAAFERSRGMAEERLKEVAAEAQSTRDSAKLVEKLYEFKTGTEVRVIKLADLEKEWVKLPRRRPLAKKYEQEGRSILARFVEFVRKRNRRAVELAHVDEAAVTAFMEAETARKVSARTWNGSLKLLRSTFLHLLPSGAPDPFAKLVTQEEETVFRKPFTPVELRAILDEAKDDELIRPILVTGMCTAMRRGDCCRLQWKDVDLERGFVTVKTAKTGGTVSIPIFGLFRDELVRAGLATSEGGRNGQAEPAPHMPNGSLSPSEPDRPSRGEGVARSKDVNLGLGGRRSAPHPYQGWVFPEAAAMYGDNPYGITARVKKVLWASLSKLAAPCGAGPSGQAPGAEAPKELPEASAEEVRRRGEEYVAGLTTGERRETMGKVFRQYVDGASVAKVAKTVGVSQSTVSLYLNEIEESISCKVVRRTVGIAEAVKADASVLRAERTKGLRRASVRDFHSLRVTWVTLALTAGVPLELVQRVTGHKTTDVVLKHYFRPGQEDFRLALEGAMPKLLTTGALADGEQANGQQSAGTADATAARAAKDEMRELLGRVKSKVLREQLLGIVARM